MSATDRIRLTLTAGTGGAVTLAFPRADLTAGLFELARETELADLDDIGIAELAMKIVLGAGGLALNGVAEEFTLQSWADQLSGEELARWDLCAARIDAAFPPADPGGAPEAEDCETTGRVRARLRQAAATEPRDPDGPDAGVSA